MSVGMATKSNIKGMLNFIIEGVFVTTTHQSESLKLSLFF